MQDGSGSRILETERQFIRIFSADCSGLLALRGLDKCLEIARIAICRISINSFVGNVGLLQTRAQVGKPPGATLRRSGSPQRVKLPDRSVGDEIDRTAVMTGG